MAASGRHGWPVRALLDLLVPPLCDGCGVRARPPWCEDCDREARRLRPSDPCERCAGADGPGHPCWDPALPIGATVALSRWSGPVAETVLHAKLAGRREVLVSLGARLARLVPTGADVVVPVPTVPRRARQRGLDHTAVLARSVGRCLGLPVVAALRTDAAAPDRGSLPQGERAALPPDTFVPARRAAAIHRRSVLLVDDVVTTGATVGAAVRVLESCGATACTVAVLARAGTHRLGR